MSRADLDPAVARRFLREIGQGFLGDSRAATAVREQIADFLARHGTEHPPLPILLRGEVGVGKSLLAQLIHRAGPRPDGPFVDVNCAAISCTVASSCRASRR
jgi:transcriptional regulator with AAA-type ATPase domain